MDIHVARLKGNLVKMKSDKFRNPQPRSDSNVKHRPVANPESFRWIRRIQDRLTLFGGEMLYQANGGFLVRNAEDSFDLLKRRRHAVFDEVHKRFDRGQTGVASSCAVAAAFLKVLKELEHERRIDLFQLQG